MRPCASCGAVKDGKHPSYCKACMAARSRAYYHANPEAAARRRAAWYAANPGKRTAEKTRAKRKARALGKAWAFEDPDVVKERSAQWHRDNAEHRSAYMKAWRQANPGYDNHRRRDEGTLTWSGALRADPCSYCGEVSGELDHIDPRATGGSGEWTNLTAACRSCNASKNDNTLLAYLAAR